MRVNLYEETKDWLFEDEKVDIERRVRKAAAESATPAAQKGVATLLTSSIATTIFIVGGIYLAYRILR